MEEVVVADGADFTVAEKSTEADVAEVMLHETGVVIGGSKQIFAATGAAAKAAAIHWISVERFTSAMH